MDDGSLDAQFQNSGTVCTIQEIQSLTVGGNRRLPLAFPVSVHHMNAAGLTCEIRTCDNIIGTGGFHPTVLMDLVVSSTGLNFPGE